MKFFKRQKSKHKVLEDDYSPSVDYEVLKSLTGGLGDVLPGCKNHEWVYSGSRTDVTTGATVNYYKCLKCNAEKTERA